MGRPEIGLFWFFSCQGIKAYRLAGRLGPTSEMGHLQTFPKLKDMSALHPQKQKSVALRTPKCPNLFRKIASRL
jgi:hypothetical protein